MAWLVLIVSGVLEAVWAISLDRSQGFSQVGPTIVFAIALVLSMGGLAIAMQEISVGTAYAVWVGIGASLTVTFAILTGEETVTPLKVLFLLAIVGSVIGLKLTY